MGIIMTILSILATAGFLYYMGKSGFTWGENIDDNEDEFK